MGLEQTFKDMPEEQKVKFITDQLSGIRFGELTIIMKYGKIHGYKYAGEQKFFESKPVVKPIATTPAPAPQA